MLPLQYWRGKVSLGTSGIVSKTTLVVEIYPPWWSSALCVDCLKRQVVCEAALYLEEPIPGNMGANDTSPCPISWYLWDMVL